MQTAQSRAETLFVVSISYDNKRYAISASLMINSLIISVLVNIALVWTLLTLTGPFSSWIVQLIGLVGRVFARGQGNLGSVPGHVLPN